VVIAMSLPALLETACSGEADDDEAAPCITATLTSIYADRLSRPELCAAPACHDTSNAGGQSYTVAKDAVRTMLLADTLHPVGKATWPKRVVPGQPDDSFLLVKLTAPDPPGDRMPLGRPALQQCDLDAIRTWITGGALDD
jgi:hypothetical protein